MLLLAHAGGRVTGLLRRTAVSAIHSTPVLRLDPLSVKHPHPAAGVGGAAGAALEKRAVLAGWDLGAVLVVLVAAATAKPGQEGRGAGGAGAGGGPQSVTTGEIGLITAAPPVLLQELTIAHFGTGPSKQLPVTFWIHTFRKP